MSTPASPTFTLLSRMALFKGLTPTQLEQLSREFDTVDVEAGERLYSQSEQPDAFYILISGQLEVFRKVKKDTQQLGVISPGESAGEEALLLSTRHRATVKALKPSRLLRLTKPQFIRLMQTYPDARLFLNAVLESRRLVQEKAYTWLGPGETIFLMSRKHPAYLVVALFGPVVLGWIALGVLFAGFWMDGSSIGIALTWFGGALFVGAALWAVWNWIDWGNDYYIVTNQRVIWLEKVVALYDSREEAPLATVLTVGLNRDLFGRLLGYGDVQIRTFTGEITLRKIGTPEQVSGLIDELIARSKVAAQKSETAALQRTIRQRLGLAVEEPQPAPEPKKEPIPKRSLGKFLSQLFQVRYEHGGVVTFRKHWIILIGHIMVPSLIILGLLAVSVARLAGYLNIFPTLITLVVTFTFILIIMVWWGYEYVDWINDIYQVTTEQIIDIYRKPLGSEDRKAAPLENILSLQHERIGLTGLILNYGNVVIMVGAVQFTFDHVYNPPMVQQVIFERMNARKRALKDVEAAREREKIADWVAVYHEQIEALGRSQNPPENS